MSVWSILALLALVSGLVLLSAKRLHRATGLSPKASAVGAFLLIAAGIALLLLPKPGGFALNPETHGALRSGSWIFVVPKYMDRADPGAHLIPLLRMIFVTLLPVVAVGFGTMLVRKWLGISITPEEQQPGDVGLRAWLRPGRVLAAATVAAGLWIWIDMPLVLGVALTFGAIVVFPLSRWTLSGETTEMQSPVHQFDEREKVLNMIAENRISVAEGAELLNALAASHSPARNTRPILTSGRILSLAGAALVVIGFFLPWFSVNVEREMGRLQQTLGETVTQSTSYSAMQETRIPVTLHQVGGLPFKVNSIQVAGPDVRHGVGWLILFLALSVAVLRVLPTALSEHGHRLFGTIGLSLAGMLLLYIIGSNVMYVTFGLIVVLTGFVLQVIGCVRDGRVGPDSAG